MACGKNWGMYINVFLHVDTYFTKIKESNWTTKVTLNLCPICRGHYPTPT